MKKFDIKNNKAVIYINRLDLYTLVKIRKYLRAELFQEDSILKDECDENGNYQITQILNVNYIKGLAFIPHYNYLLKFDCAQLEEMLENAMQNLDDAERIFEIPCDRYTPLDEKDKIFLRSLKEVDQALIELFISKNPENENEWIEMCDIVICIREEFRNYIRCVCEMIHYKENFEKKNKVTNTSQVKQQNEKKHFSLRKIFGFICK